MYESFEPWHLRDNYKVKKVHAHSPPLSKNTHVLIKALQQKFGEVSVATTGQDKPSEPSAPMIGLSLLGGSQDVGLSSMGKVLKRVGGLF